MNAITKIKTFIKTNHLFSKGERIVLGVSGGPDSVFLLHVIDHLRHELGLSLIVAHINHHLRKDSKMDESFVKNLCQELSLLFVRKDVRIVKRKGQSSIEEIARDKRFCALIEIAKKNNARKIVLGHNLDDLAETVLMRILRGTGLSGMRAILPQRQIQGITFVRPILDISRLEILHFLKSKKLTFRLDPTNTSLDFTRNKLRHKLIPLLERNYNPNIKQTLANLSKTVSFDYDFIRRKGEGLAKKIVIFSRSGNKLHIHRVLFEKEHISLKRDILRFVIEQLTDSQYPLTLSHILEIEKFLEGSSSKTLSNLPLGLRLTRSRDFFTFQREKI